MKHVIFRHNVNDKSVHVRRNMWGHVVLPSNAYRSFKELRHDRFYHPNYTWKLLCKAYRKKVRKMKIAKLSRKGSKKRIKQVR